VPQARPPVVEPVETQFVCQPLTEPSITPETKYRWTNG
jgi:hypothetical protein